MSDVEAQPPSSHEAGQRRDYDLEAELPIDTPAQLKALGDPLRSTIVDLVLERAMSVTELADLLDRPRGSVAYHVDVLVDAGLIAVVRTRKVRAVEERFYGRTALTYALPRPTGELPFLRDVIAEMDVDRMTGDRKLGTSTYRHARIPEHRVDEFARRLHALAVEFADGPRSGDTEFGLYLALFPTNRLPARKPVGADEAPAAAIEIRPDTIEDERP